MNRAVIEHSHVICCGHVPANPSRTHSEDQQHGQLLTGHVLNLHAVSPGNSSESQPVHHKIPEPEIKVGRHPRLNKSVYTQRTYFKQPSKLHGIATPRACSLTCHFGSHQAGHLDHVRSRRGKHHSPPGALLQRQEGEAQTR